MNSSRYMLSKTGPWGLFLFVLVVFQIQLVKDSYAQSETVAQLPNPLDPRALYDQMLASKAQYDFEGILTYEQAGQLQSFSVKSRHVEGVVEQKIMQLNGPDSEHHMYFDRECDNFSGIGSAELSNYYNFYTRSEARVAGLNGIEIIISPVDKYRNGFQFVIEEETGLMLRSIVLTPERRVVERMQFASLSFQESDLENQESEQTEEFRSHAENIEESSEAATQILCDQLSIDNGWRANWVPEGFELYESQLEADRASLVYGDGLSVFSVIIEPVLETFLPPSNAHRGATTMYVNYLSSPTETYLVSVVGEIPLATAERVLSSLRKE